MSYLSLLYNAAPQALLCLASALLLFVDFALVRRCSIAIRSTVAVTFAIAGSAAAAAWTIYSPSLQIHGFLLSHSYQRGSHVALLFVTILTLLLVIANNFTDHPAEFIFLVLLATIGMLSLLEAENLLTFFLSLELLSLSLYALAAFDHIGQYSSEAALKYFFFGGISAAFLLFGFSFLYGLTGSLSLSGIGTALQAQAGTPLVTAALVCTLIGFGFKIAAAPFHFWAPDVYEAAAPPPAAFIASSSKIASFIAFFLFFTTALHGVQGSAAWGAMHSGWASALAVVAVISMLLGNLVALRQTRLRRLIAYSAIGHAGYMLLAFAAPSTSYASLQFYIVTYAIGTAGLFAVSAAVESAFGSDHLSHLDGLVRRSPVLAACLLIFVLSLAGIPPLSGFFAKFYVFLAALQTPGLLWLVILALASSAVALYYYLQLARRALIANPEAHTASFAPHWTHVAVAVTAALLVVLAGVFPATVLRWLS